MSEVLPFSGALALTNVLIGRDDALATIHDVVQPQAGSAFYCLLVGAPGGKGKTRLLREVCGLLGAPALGYEPHTDRDHPWASESVVCLSLIDVAEPHLHGVVAFLRDVRAGFLRQPRFAGKLLFDEFDREVVRYEQTRDGGFSFADVQHAAETVVDAFERDYRLLTQTVRVVWVIDTMEQLYAVPQEIETLLGSMPIRTTKARSTYDWLKRFVEKRPANTTLLLAGRPQPGRWLREIRDLLGPGQVLLEVDDFTEAETHAYLEALRDQLAANSAYQVSAAYLRHLVADEEQVTLLYELTQGNPIRLSLYIDLLVNGDSPPAPFRRRAGEVRAMVAEERKQLVEDVDRVLLRYLSEMVGDPVSQALEYLAAMRRGLDVERLIHIWGGDRQQAKEALEHLLRLSFVKSRPDGTLLLHDEAYTIYQQQFVREPEEQRRIQRERHIQLFQSLVNYSRDRASYLTQEIWKEQAKIEETPVDTMKTGYLNLKQRLQDYRRERRRMYAEQVHYSLYLDPPHGFASTYFQLAEQAFAATDPELDVLLQSEIELFFFGVRPDLNQQQSNVADDDWELLRFAVVHDRVSRWIKRITLLSDLSSAQHLATRANERHEALIDGLYKWTRDIRATAEGRVVSQLFAKEWQACGDFAALLSGEQIEATLRRLENIIRYFEEVLTTDKQRSDELQPTRRALRQRLLNMLAQCLLYIGYGYATRNDFKQALNYYRQADAILKRTKFTALHAEVQNDMSRVLSELGDSNTALTICQDALQMRTSLGFDYLIALSRSTLALIHIKNARPTSARYYAETALSLCRQLNNPRGIGLALRQLAEAKRRIWNLTADEVRRDSLKLGDLGDKVELLSEAAEHIGEAEYIFKEVFRERPRLIDAQIEAGCLYREWATFLRQGPGEAYFDRAVGYLDNAILAAKEDYPQHYVTALVNKAWLYGHMGLPADALRVAEEAVAAAPPEYRFQEDIPLDLKATQNVVYFREFSKLDALYATLLSNDDARALKHLVFAITYMQLFSPNDTWYLGQNKRAFAAKCNSLLDRREFLEQVVGKIIAQYHLRELEQHIGSLQVEQVMREVLTVPPDLPFID